jgi:hypothetical protein
MAFWQLEDRKARAHGVLATYQGLTFGMGALVPRPTSSSWGEHEDYSLLPYEAMSPMCAVTENGLQGNVLRPLDGS